MRARNSPVGSAGIDLWPRARRDKMSAMQVQLKRPELEKFIDEQVKAGLYPSREAAVEAAVEQMMNWQQEPVLTGEDVDAINESEAQIDRGEHVEFDALAAEMRKKYCGK